MWAHFGRNISWIRYAHSTDLYRLFRTYRKCQKVRDCWVIHLCMMSLAVRVPFDDPLFHPKKMYVNGNSTRLLILRALQLYISLPTRTPSTKVRFKGKRSTSVQMRYFFFLKRIKTHFCYTSSRDLEMKTLGKALGGPPVTHLLKDYWGIVQDMEHCVLY